MKEQGVLGIRIRDHRMVGVDESIELGMTAPDHKLLELLVSTSVTRLWNKNMPNVFPILPKK